MRGPLDPQVSTALDSRMGRGYFLRVSLGSPDHLASLEPGELAGMVRGIRRIEVALGGGVKESRPSEVAVAAIARKSLHAASDLDIGTVLSPVHLVALCPGTGIPPYRLDRIVGRTLLRGGSEGELLRKSDLG